MLKRIIMFNLIKRFILASKRFTSGPFDGEDHCCTSGATTHWCVAMVLSGAIFSWDVLLLRKLFRLIRLLGIVKGFLILFSGVESSRFFFNVFCLNGMEAQLRSSHKPFNTLLLWCLTAFRGPHLGLKLLLLLPKTTDNRSFSRMHGKLSASYVILVLPRHTSCTRFDDWSAWCTQRFQHSLISQWTLT